MLEEEALMLPDLDGRTLAIRHRVADGGFVVGRLQVIGREYFSGMVAVSIGKKCPSVALRESPVG